MSDPAFAENPWSDEHWNLTRQGQYVAKYGEEIAKTKAKQAGKKLHHHHKRLRAVGGHGGTHITIQKKTINNYSQGFAGIGPPDPDL